MLNKFDKKIPVETWTRCVGYFRTTATFNPGKKEEVSDRKMYNPQKIESDIKKELTYV